MCLCVFNLHRMNYTKISINTALPEKPKARVMIIYTGGTFGMAHDTWAYWCPLISRSSWSTFHLAQFVSRSDGDLFSIILSILSNVDPSHWKTIGTIIEEHYNEQDGFVVLHGTDTMAYTTSALSFMLQGLNKPVVFTGAQLPISEPRSDARENLITSLEIAAAKKDGRAIVPEVCLYFDMPCCAAAVPKKWRACTSMRLNQKIILRWRRPASRSIMISERFELPRPEPLSCSRKFDSAISILKLFPGISPATVSFHFVHAGSQRIDPGDIWFRQCSLGSWFIDLLKGAIQEEVIILNISQCPGGMVIQGRYETSKTLDRLE